MTALPHTTIAQALLARAAAQPATAALLAPGRPALTFAELGVQIAYVRERFGEWGIAPGDVVAGVITDRNALAAACACFPVSATFAPLNPALGREAYGALLDRLRPKAVVVAAHGEHAFIAAARERGIAEVHLKVLDGEAPAGRHTLHLERRGASLARHAAAQPEHAYLVVTSGTTGQPKIVPLSHQQELLRAPTMGRWLRYDANDVGCHVLPLHLSHGLRAALLDPLLNGASVLCLDEADVGGLLAALEEFRPTVLSAGFTLCRDLLAGLDERQQRGHAGCLRFLRVGSGRLEPREIDRLEEALRAPVLVGYSATETCVIAHDPLPPLPRKRGTVGRLVDVELATLDTAGRIDITGGVGEIIVRGPMVFDGYFDEPALTAQAFVDGWYRTGDLGCVDADGCVHLMGRLKELINRGGEKISPVEIDRVLETMCGVKEAATFGVPHPRLGEEVVAAVVRDGHASLDEAGVLAEARQRLGGMRAPRRVYFLERLPRNPAGKLLRAELAQLVQVRSDAKPQDGDDGTASLPVEAQLAPLWCSVLGRQHVQRGDDFFLAGGDSLCGARLLARIERVFGVTLSLQALFGEAATLGGMARLIEARQHLPVAGTGLGDPIARTQRAGLSVPMPRAIRADVKRRGR
ncbi:MAG: non-ribosomal peptide synthetase [Betaproteobacteria bacterium]